MPRKQRVVIDTNVLLSAILFGGNPLKLLNLWRFQHAFDLVISPEILAELVGKLKTKFALPNDLVLEWQELLSENTIHVLPDYVTEICRDADDDKFLDTALTGNATYLVTGDKDLLDSKKHENIKILKAKDYLDALNR